ncbi:response regulator [Desulfolutivibrio sulfoxidireducens]|uniref:response regulator n=1 Tax=Desulfolutivibrio sulfoxidireducens TaxID=2773299 RepID=UPI00159DE82B|nr:response regulator [Desulfolutivibrio sulfoxidireducens]QLA17538.1 response regulator [Desulfolutivibrio sulfoxidireducens]QLA21124.1 response regulator [Desulfolutivibrio sulfoxidireducens]
MSKCRVLLVDDEEAYVETLAKRLTRRGLTVFTANRGERALEVLAGNPVDVVILDMKMPGMDGIETLTRIKRDHADVEVIMLTGHANVDAAIQGMEQGAFDYLMKPAEMDDLFYKIEDAHKKRVLAGHAANCP